MAHQSITDRWIIHVRDSTPHFLVGATMNHINSMRRHYHVAMAMGLLVFLVVVQYSIDSHFDDLASLAVAFRVVKPNNAANDTDNGSNLTCDLSNLPLAYPNTDVHGNNNQTNSKTHHTEDEPTIYFVVTASLKLTTRLMNDTSRHYNYTIGEQEIYDIRQQQYTRGIQRLLNETSKLTKKYQIVIVENNGPRITFLNDFGLPVLYTHHNLVHDHIVHNQSNSTVPNNSNNNSMIIINKKNKGLKELYDIRDCISHFGMRDSDVVVKMTGRYYLEEDSCFIQTLQRLDLRQTRGIVKFGSMLWPVSYRKEDCITGLIMLPVYAIQNLWNTINKTSDQPVEWDWAKAALSLQPNDTAVLAVRGKLGIYMAPGGGNGYFLSRR